MDKDNTQTQDQTQAPQVPQDNQAPQEEKVMTQEQINKLISQAFAKGAKSAAKEQEQKNNEDFSKQIEEITGKLQQANEQLLQAEVVNQCNSIGITENGSKLAIKGISFNDCYDDSGEISQEKIKLQLEEFAKEFPEVVGNKKPAVYSSASGNSAKKPPRMELNKNRIIK